MEVTVARVALVNAVAKAKLGMAARSTLPSLRNVHLQAAEGEGLSAECTDLDTWVRARIPEAQVQCPGETAVPCNKLLKLLKLFKSLSEATVTLTQQEFSLQIVCGTQQFSLPTFPADAYPVREFQCREAEAEFLRQALLDGLQDVLWAASTVDATQYMLYSVLFDSEQLVATNTHKLAILPFPCASLAGAILPAKALSSLGKLWVKSSEEYLTVRVQPHTSSDSSGKSYQLFDYVEFSTATESLVLRPIEGQFPNWRHVVSAGEELYSSSFDVPQGLLEFARLANELDTGGKLYLTIPDDGDGTYLLVEFDSSEAQKMESVRIPLAHAAESCYTAVAPRYLQEVLKVVGPKASVNVPCMVKHNGSGYPIKFVRADGLTVLLMPMRRRDAECEAALARKQAQSSPPQL